MMAGAPPDDPEFVTPKGPRETVQRVAEDGTTHRYRWNDETKDYDIDLGPVPPKSKPPEEVEP